MRFNVQRVNSMAKEFVQEEVEVTRPRPVKVARGLVEGHGVIAFRQTEPRRVIHRRQTKLDARFAVADPRPKPRLEVFPLNDVHVGRGEIRVHGIHLRKGHVDGAVEGNAGVLEVGRHRDEQHVVAIGAVPLLLEHIAHRIHTQLVRLPSLRNAQHVGSNRVHATGALGSHRARVKTKDTQGQRQKEKAFHSHRLPQRYRGAAQEHPLTGSPTRTVGTPLYLQACREEPACAKLKGARFLRT